MLRIITVMVGDVFKFLAIWSVLLALLASVASLLFGSIPKYSTFKNVLLTMFGTGLGSYDLADFTDHELKAESGEVLTILAVIINNVVLLNFIIAILADTYSKLSSQSLGLYYDGIISRIPVYEDDSRYGALIVGTPPCNSLAIVLIPVYSCIRNEQVLKKVNDAATKLMYAPVALLLTLVFMALNLALLPFAYFVSIYQKLMLLKHKAAGQDSRRMGSKKVRPVSAVAVDLAVFIVFGVPLLILSQLADAFYFVASIYRSDVMAYGALESDVEFTMSEMQFAMLEQFFSDEM